MSKEMIELTKRALEQIDIEITELIEDLEVRANPIDTIRGYGFLPEDIIIRNSYVVRNNLQRLVDLGARREQLRRMIVDI